jgi:hypothetical protein
MSAALDNAQVATVTVVPLGWAGVTHVCENLRPRDHEEIFALRWDDNLRTLAAEIYQLRNPLVFMHLRDGVPAAIQGVAPLWPHVWTVFAFGTDQFQSVLLSMTKCARRIIIPALLRADFHRAEARALASHTDARTWIEALGGRQEGILQAYGRNREDFVSYVWTPEDVLRKQ